MTELQQKQLALLEDTIKFFNSENRAEYNGKCTYHTEDGRGCAIGRLIPDKELCKKFDALEDSPVYEERVFSNLPDNVKEYGKFFLSELQKLHDHTECWSINGLSSIGEVKVQKIKHAFDLN